ncbi:MAG: hypothetical protein IKP37_06995 [Paludibacteraceae bacterium]|nr:hypothetical protein [Paludibacteraceae bacterium]
MRLLVILLVAINSFTTAASEKVCNDSLRTLISSCLDSCRVNDMYCGILNDMIFNNPLFDSIDSTCLSNHDLMRIQLLVKGEYEDWELDKIVTYQKHKYHIDNKVKHDAIFTSLRSTELKEKRKQIITDSILCDLKRDQKEERHSVQCVYNLILNLNLRHFIPLIINEINSKKKVYCFYCDRELTLAFFGIEPYLSNSIKKYGYNPKTGNIYDSFTLELLGTPKAIYEISKALKSTSHDMWTSAGGVYRIRDFYLMHLSEIVDGFPYKEYVCDDWYDCEKCKISKRKWNRIIKWFEENKENLKLNESYYNEIHIRRIVF